MNACHEVGYGIVLDSMMKKGTSLGRVSNFELLEEIGQSGMACVYRGLDVRSETVVAVKRVRTDGATLDEAAIRREIEICTRLQEIPSPHILTVKGSAKQNRLATLSC